MVAPPLRYGWEDGGRVGSEYGRLGQAAVVSSISERRSGLIWTGMVRLMSISIEVVTSGVGT